MIGYFEDEVIGGPHAFIEPVTAERNYTEAVHRKLLREIGMPIYSGTTGQGQTTTIDADLVPRRLERAAR